jgi:uncharacterized protein YjiS (DUF1127 family)
MSKTNDFNEVEAWARQARGASGFGDASDAELRPLRMSYELYHAARTGRAFLLGEIFAAMFEAAGDLVRRAYEGYRQRREAAATCEALSELDDRTLRDLGFHRSEIRSIAAEWTGEAEPSRVRTAQNDEVATPGRETATPRAALVAAAAAMTAMTIGMTVVVPAKIEDASNTRTSGVASQVVSDALEDAVDAATVDFVAFHELADGQCPTDDPSRVAAQVAPGPQATTVAAKSTAARTAKSKTL